MCLVKPAQFVKKRLHRGFQHGMLCGLNLGARGMKSVGLLLVNHYIYLCSCLHLPVECETDAKGTASARRPLDNSVFMIVDGHQDINSVHVSCASHLETTKGPSPVQYAAQWI